MNTVELENAVEPGAAESSVLGLSEVELENVVEPEGGGDIAENDLMVLKKVDMGARSRQRRRSIKLGEEIVD